LVIPNLGLGLADSFAGSLEVGAGHHHFLHRLILIARSVGESYGEGRGVEFDDLDVLRVFGDVGRRYLEASFFLASLLLLTTKK
jgi:hypothetical protein